MERINLYADQYLSTNETIDRGDIIPKNKYALIVFACIFNSDGEMLIQQRQFNKKGWPGMWDVSVGGAVLSDEKSLDAIQREIKEELGIIVDKKDLKKKLSLYYEDTIHDIYTCKKDIQLQDIILQEEEVADIKFATYNDIIKMIDNNLFIPIYKEFIGLIFNMIDKPGILFTNN